MIRNLFLVFLITMILGICGSSALAQHSKVATNNDAGLVKNTVGTRSQINTLACSGLAKPRFNLTPWLVNIKNVEKRHTFSEEVAAIKTSKTQYKLQNTYIEDKKETIVESVLNNVGLGTNFKGNIFNGGAPTDNTIAVSNSGHIVSVINCNVAYYDVSGNNLWAGSFWELFDDASLTELIYDPIVMYDSEEDRFVMIALHGFTSEKSKVILAFSKTNNPVDGWWIYKLSGNPLNNSCWLDYPKLGISNNEIYITGNLFSDLTGFSEAVIYQISKDNGLIGANLDWIIWSDIAGSPITIVPASYGQQGNYGPGIYFVSQSPGSGNSVDLYELTQDLNVNPQLTRNTIYKYDYSPSGNALQSGSSVELITGDCRIINAFYLNGIIHYVFQSDFQGTNYTGINYNQLNVNSLTNSTYTYGQVGSDYAYPSVASYATSASDKSVVICFLNSNATIFPEIRAVICDDAQNWSNSILVKEGNNYVDAFAYDNTVRWGDYTGISRKHNAATPEVWLSGCFGSTQNVNGTNYKCFNTWIAEIANFSVDIDEIKDEKSNSIGVYPNPIVNLYTIDFDLAQVSTVTIEISDLSGKKMSTLFNGRLKKGKNILTYNKNALSSGTYFISIYENNKTLATQKILVN